MLDLRGAAPPADLFERSSFKTAEGRISTTVPLLILGDHALLDASKWLKLARGHYRSPRPGVLWWPDNSLPPSLESQLRLMQLFTQWNVFLGEPPKEADNENRKNEP